MHVEYLRLVFWYTLQLLSWLEKNS